MSSAPLYISSQTNSSVYVATRVLQARRQTNVLPQSGDCRGILPDGYFERKASSDMTFALPLIEARGFSSQDGEM